MFDLVIQCGVHGTAIAARVDVLRELGMLVRTQAAEPAGVQAVVVTDGHVAPLYGGTVLQSLAQAGFQTLVYSIEPGEASKGLAAIGDIYRFLAEHNVGRDAIVVAVGGGVVSDVAGFVAATWMRGVRFVICPTTLEADLDAAVGGKTAINIPGGKNLVGAFWQPILVAIDPGCLKTLDMRDVRAGLAESVKHALISSTGFLDWHEAHAAEILALEPTPIRRLILDNLRVKARIVEQDVHERKGLRMQLNFGHTIGHAIEECSGFALRHGECVSLGMLAACRLSQEVGSLEVSTVERVGRLLGRLGLLTKLTDPIPTDRIMAAIRNDKKVRGGTWNFVLLDEIGRPSIRQDIAEEQIRRAYESLLP